MNWRCFRSSWPPRRRWWTAPRRAVLPLKTARGLLHIRDRKRRRDNTADDYRRAAAAALAPASSSQAQQLSRPPLLRSKHITNIDSLSLSLKETFATHCQLSSLVIPPPHSLFPLTLYTTCCALLLYMAFGSASWKQLYEDQKLSTTTLSPSHAGSYVVLDRKFSWPTVLCGSSLPSKVYTTRDVSKIPLDSPSACITTAMAINLIKMAPSNSSSSSRILTTNAWAPTQVTSRTDENSRSRNWNVISLFVPVQRHVRIMADIKRCAAAAAAAAPMAHVNICKNVVCHSITSA